MDHFTVMDLNAGRKGKCADQDAFAERHSVSHTGQTHSSASLEVAMPDQPSAGRTRATWSRIRADLAPQRRFLEVSAGADQENEQAQGVQKCAIDATLWLEKSQVRRALVRWALGAARTVYPAISRILGSALLSPASHAANAR